MGNRLIIEVKKVSPDAVMPQRMHGTDAGYDLFAIKRTMDEYGNYVYHTGIAMAIPDGYVGLIYPRSSVCTKSMILTNCVGVIDAGYRGEITLKFKQAYGFGNPDSWVEDVYPTCARVGQIIIQKLPRVSFIEVDQLPFGERGANGYGSTGE